MAQQTIGVQAPALSGLAARLSPERLLRDAERTTELRAWGEPAFTPSLERLCRSAVDEAGFDDASADRFAATLSVSLVKRLRLYADRARYPEIAVQEIRAPLVVTGLPRSGTTILHALMAQDPGARSVRTWELDQPSPPPRAETYETDSRIAQSQHAVDQLPAQFKAMHAMGATLPEECNNIMMMAFLSPNFGATARVSSYLRWLVDEADMTPAFELHRHVLQHLQAFKPGDYWLLKAPPYLWWLGDLVKAYPDARIVITHRDPAQVIPSNASLIAFLQGRTSDAGRLEIGTEQLDIWQHGVDRMLAFRGGRADAIVDSLYVDFIRNPLAVVRAIYDGFGMTLSDKALAAMQAFMADNQQNKHGKHEYSAESYGLSTDRIHRQFAPYIEAFSIPTA
jgi:hypothetical protein